MPSLTMYKIAQGDCETHLQAGTVVAGVTVESLLVGDQVSLNEIIGALTITAIDTYVMEE